VLDLNSVVLDCEKMLGRLLGEDVELTTQRDPALVPVWADAGQVEQILLNLVVNARDAMPRGGRLTLRTRNAAYGPNLLPFALLEVTDTGVGMDQATQARIFEPFFTTKGNRGTGLGLATVHDIVHTANGCVEVVSAPGAGSTFTVYLPGAQGAASAGPNPIAPAASMPQGTETVLLVEDDESVRTLTRGMLRTLGYRVLDANRAREALALSQRHPGPIHLLLTDVVMPEMSGRDLAELLVTLRPELRVLYMSGYTDDALLRHSVSRAEMAFLQKPFTPASLAAKVRESLDAVKETHR
jgi:CheY-like chemotaxis protein